MHRLDYTHRLAKYLSSRYCVDSCPAGFYGSGYYYYYYYYCCQYYYYYYYYCYYDYAYYYDYD